jgi:hypothetical protein
VGICCVLVRYDYKLPLIDQWFDYRVVGMLFLYIALALSVGSAVEYTMAFRRALQEHSGSGRG